MKEKNMGFTNREILDIAMKQSAIELGCEPSDFTKSENVAAVSKSSPDARKYLTTPHNALPYDCNIVSYGNNVVAGAKESYLPFVKDYIDRYGFPHCFETPSLHVLEEKFSPYGKSVCFMAEYFLPDVTKMQLFDCGYELKILGRAQFENLYIDEWSNAICIERKQLDVLGVGAYDGEKLVGLAACSADCENMWQIGVDVLPGYRRKNVACSVTSHLAKEILERGKVPFYCSAWSNIRSVKNAVKCGFYPAWIELTVRDKELIEILNSDD